MNKIVFITGILLTFVCNLCFAMDNNITVYYFHSSVRCKTCINIERMTKEAVNSIPTTTFKAINTDETDNKHYLTDYGLYTKSVVLVKPTGEWKNLDKIWSLVRSEDDFKNYITTETNNFMEK